MCDDSNPVIQDLIKEFNTINKNLRDEVEKWQELSNKKQKGEKKEELAELPFSLYFSTDDFVKMVNCGAKRRPAEIEEVGSFEVSNPESMMDPDNDPDEMWE